MNKLTALIVFILLFALPAFSAGEESDLSSGQTIYVAIYSHVFTGPKEIPFNLSAMLSIRNTDLHNPITILSAEYFDNEGNSLKQYVPKPISLPPLASHHFSIKETDETGGFGANFIVKWEATQKVNSPIVEGVMIGARSGQGTSFVCQGKVITEKTK